MKRLKHVRLIVLAIIDFVVKDYVYRPICEVRRSYNDMGSIFWYCR